MSSKLPVCPRVKPQFTRNGIEHADWKPPKMVYQQSDRDIKVIEPTHHADQAGVDPLIETARNRDSCGWLLGALQQQG